jgi:BNR repeat protein
MRFLQPFIVVFLSTFLVLSCKEHHEESIKHSTVYYEAGRFGGWPANHGIWSWGDEILVGFAKGYHKNLGTERHNIDREKPQEEMFARSLDGGETWQIEDPSKDGVIIARGASLHGTEPDPENMPPITKLSEPMDFSKPGFALKFWMLSSGSGPSIFYYSYDKGHTWKGPHSLEVAGNEKIAARIDYMIEDNNSCMAFLTAAKKNDREGHVFAARTDDGGISWQLVSMVGEEPKNGFRIMPSTVRTSATELVLTSRVREELADELTPSEKKNSRYIDAWLSIDNAKSWEYLGRPVKDLGEGNPPSLIKLKDGRLCLTYGYRANPYSIRAKISEDNGRTWGKEIMLRDDGSGRDVGYVRSVQRPDGKVVTLYYFQDGKNPERFIGCTIWNPNIEFNN